MGFYNIFRIIRLILKDIFGYKTFRKILIIILLIFSLCFFYTKCFCASDNRTSVEFSPTGWNYTFIVNNLNNYYIITYSYTYLWPNNQKDYHVGVVLSSSPFTVIETTENYYKLSSNGIKNYDRYTRTSGGALPSTSAFDTLLSNLNSDISNFNGSFSSTTYNLFYNLTDNEIFSFQDVYDTNNNLVFGNSMYISPSLSNSQSELENLSFNNFIINANSFTQTMSENPDTPLVLLFYNRSLSNNQNTDGLYPIKEKYFYKESIYFDSENSTDTNYVFTYPIFRSGVFFNIGSTYEIKLAKRVYIPEYNTWGYDYFSNSYTFTVSSNVTQDYINQLNQQTATSIDEDNQQEQLNAINNQTQAIENQTQSIDNINNSITNSTVDNSSIELPTDNTNDPTQSGVDNIFQTIYNSFTSGTPQNIVFPIPFSDNNLTIEPSYVSNMLGSSSRWQSYYNFYTSILLVFNQSIYYYRYHAKSKEDKTR